MRSAIRKCHQTLWEGGKRSPIGAFGEFCKIIFVKHRDEKNADREDGKRYAFQRRDGESAAQLAARVYALYDAEKATDPTVFEDRINVDPSILAQTRHMMTGNTHPRFANEDVADLIAPVPDVATQESIAAEIRRRRERFRTLREEAEAGWAETKRWFEEQLLGPAR